MSRTDSGRRPDYSRPQPDGNPIVIPSTRKWDQDANGNWSTFNLTLGTPSQSVRVLISMSYDGIFVIGPNSSCPTGGDINRDCSEQHGGLFKPGDSSTWNSSKTFSTDGAQSGREIVHIEDFLTPQTVEVITSSSSQNWLGRLGLNYGGRSVFANSLSTHGQKITPSDSWGYTAGASYRPGAPVGSLTLGGYDSNKISQQNITFHMGENAPRKFVVNLNVLHIDDRTKPSSISEGVNIKIDSMIPYFLLPQKYCALFEDYFGLLWDSDKSLYTLDPQKDASLNVSSRESAFTFTLANTEGNMVNFTFPYSAFSITPKYLGTENVTMSSFPLRRALNDSEYTLGNAFLQESYLLANYEKSTFTLSPITWTPIPKPNIIAIPAASATTATSTPTSTSPSMPNESSSNQLPLQRILIPSLLITALILTIFIIFRYFRNHKVVQALKRKLKLDTPNADSPVDRTKLPQRSFRKPQLDTENTEILEIGNSEIRPEIDGRPVYTEVSNGTEILEMEGNDKHNLAEVE